METRRQHNSYVLLVKTPGPQVSEACPIKIPDIDGLFVKVFRETLSTFRCYLHFSNGSTLGQLKAIDFGGSVEECEFFDRPFWEKVNAQLVGLQIWEFGKRPRSAYGQRKRHLEMSSVNVGLFKKKYKL